MTTLGHAEQNAGDIILTSRVCYIKQLSVKLELEVTCPYYFGATKDQCQDPSWPHSACLVPLNVAS